MRARKMASPPHVFVPEVTITERDARREFQIALLEFGADDCPYVMCQSGPGAVHNIVMEPNERVLMPGDVLCIDTGARFEGYWSDFDRNFIVSHHKDPRTEPTHDLLWRATEAGFAKCVEGCTSTDVFHAMVAVMASTGEFDPDTFSTGRLGHGVGLNLTEHFSNKPGDDTPLKEGMCITLEPGMPILGMRPDEELIIVHEEVVVIGAPGEGPKWLSNRAPRKMVTILP
jgi:Xaa-Pro aminopeptidase